MKINLAKCLLLVSLLLINGCASTQAPVTSQADKVTSYPSLSLNHFIADLIDVLKAQDQQAYFAMWDSNEFSDRTIDLVKERDYSATELRKLLIKESVFKRVTNSNLEIFKESQPILLETDVANSKVAKIKLSVKTAEDNVYIGFVLSTYNGVYKIVDIYDYSMGIYQSQKSAKMFDNYYNNSIEAEATIKTLAQSIQASHNNEKQRAINILKTIPEPILSQKGMLTTYIVTASYDEAELISALELLEKYYADDPSVSFMMAQLYYLRNQNEQSIEAFKTFASIIGPAPDIQVIIANLYLHNNDIENAITYANNAIRIDSHTSLAYWVLAKAFILNNELEDAFFAIQVLQNYFGYNFTASGIKTEEDLKPLYQLASFNDWIKTLPE